MIGSIVKVNGREGLFVVVNFENRETDWYCSYDRTYYLIPYEPDKDTLEINLNDSMITIKVTGFIDPVDICEDKMPYKQYGESKIRGAHKIYLERTWETPKMPER
jgi:hypothetical protein